MEETLGRRCAYKLLLFSLVHSISTSVCVLRMGVQACVCVRIGERWFQSVDCDSFSWEQEETVRQPLLKQQRGVSTHCGDNGLFENKKALPSCILEGTYVCLSLLLSTASTTVAETIESSAARVPRGGELACQARLI